MDIARLWWFLPRGYLLTVAIETPILLVGLSPVHPTRRKVAAGLWLTACTYPIVVLVLPSLLDPRALYLAVAETFAPVAECLLFRLAFGTSGEQVRRVIWRDRTAIAAANLASFAAGELLTRVDGWGFLGPVP